MIFYIQQKDHSDLFGFWCIIRENGNFQSRFGTKMGMFAQKTLHHIINQIWCVVVKKPNAFL